MVVAPSFFPEFLVTEERSVTVAYSPWLVLSSLTCLIREAMSAKYLDLGICRNFGLSFEGDTGEDSSSRGN